MNDITRFQDYVAHLAERFGLLLAALAGFSLPLAFAPFSLEPVAILSLAALILLWTGATPRAAARRGFAWGVGAYLGGLYWLYISLHTFGKAPLWLSIPLMLGVVLIMALYPALAGYVFARFAPRSRCLSLMVFFPATWALLEWLRGWLASGFPWLALGYSQIDTVLAGFAPLGGVYLAGAAVALTAGALACLVLSAGRVLPLIVILVTWSGGAVLQTLQFTVANDRPITVSLAQGAVPQDRKWRPEQFRPTLELYREMTRKHRDSDLVIWPEAAIPALLGSVEDYLNALWQEALASNTGLLIGVPRQDPLSGAYFNSLVALGEQRSVYDKRHLVPFGEYFPVPGFVRSWMRLMQLPYTDFSAGAQGQAPIAIAGERVAVTICYEDVFGAEQLDNLASATLLVNVSNDAWFGDSIAPHQHLEIARMRALESGRPMLRATNTGISAFIAADGSLQAVSQQFHSEVLTRKVHGHRGKTPYMVVADWLLVALAVLGVSVSLWAGGRRRINRV